MRANGLCSSAKQEGSGHGVPRVSRSWRRERRERQRVRSVKSVLALRPSYGFSIARAMPARVRVPAREGCRFGAEPDQRSEVPDCPAPRRCFGPDSTVPHSADVLRTTERRNVPIFCTDLAAPMRGPRPCYAATRAASLLQDGSVQLMLGRQGAKSGRDDKRSSSIGWTA
jgi:hypothetical protein